MPCTDRRLAAWFGCKLDAKNYVQIIPETPTYFPICTNGVPQATASIWQMTSGTCLLRPVPRIWEAGQCRLIENLSLSDPWFGFSFGIVRAIFSEMTLLTPFTVAREVTSSEENQK